jgi:hypothetical protein
MIDGIKYFLPRTVKKGHPAQGQHMQKFLTTRVLPLALLAGWGITLSSCQDAALTNTNPMKPSRLEGRIVDRSASTPLDKVVVKVLPYNRSTETDASGKYSLSIELPDSNSVTITLITSKSGFISDTLRALVIKNDRVTAAPEIKLTREGSSGQSSGDATHIVLVKVTASNIFVAGSGGPATSSLTFEVRDAKGIPVDAQHSATVNFTITGNPGGASRAPASMLTDENGRVITTVTSGAVAGALQVVAEIAGKAIAAAPVPVAIHGGLPDEAHFSLAVEKLNIAGLLYFGLQDRITAFVGDKYSNPVPPGTVVQFRSTGGIIEGSAVTNSLGQAAVILTSASPVPAIPSNGLVTITAETVDETRAKIKTTARVLFSGSTILNLTPLTFNLAAFASQTFTYTVADPNGNPLVAGSTFTVTTDNGKVSGQTNINLKDTQSKVFTSFKFTLTNSQPDSLVAKDANVKIEVSSPNGDASLAIIGKMLKK